MFRQGLQDDSVAAFAALEMGVVYLDEIGDRITLEELKQELELLVKRSPSLSKKADALWRKLKL